MVAEIEALLAGVGPSTIRRAIASSDPVLTLWAGVACYPAHGFSTEDILDRADMALDMAREWRQDRIEVATAD